MPAELDKNAAEQVSRLWLIGKTQVRQWSNYGQGKVQEEVGDRK